MFMIRAWMGKVIPFYFHTGKDVDQWLWIEPSTLHVVKPRDAKLRITQIK